MIRVSANGFPKCTAAISAPGAAWGQPQQQWNVQQSHQQRELLVGVGELNNKRVEQEP